MQLKVLDNEQPYPDCMKEMQSVVHGIIEHNDDSQLWLLEHEPVYTAGTSADMSELVDAKFEVHKTGRGGRLTYHGTGQRIAYVIMDLKKYMDPPDLKLYVRKLEKWVINVLKQFDVEGFTRDGRVGVWVNDPELGEAKIAAIGIRVKKWVAFHGISLNYSPNLNHFDGIVPCGIREYGITSLENFGIDTDSAQIDRILVEEFEKIFNIKISQ